MASLQGPDKALMRMTPLWSPTSGAQPPEPGASYLEPHLRIPTHMPAIKNDQREGHPLIVQIILLR